MSTSVATYDAIIVGSGPNGLVAANVLADRGWSVLVLEAQPTIGGAVASARDVHPDFIHDTFSAFYPLSAASPAIRQLDLEQHGLRWSHAPAVLGHPFPDGSWALLHRDREVTARLMDARHAGDGDAWLDLCHRWDAVGDQLLGAVLKPFPPVRSGLSLLARLRKAGGLGFARALLTPATTMGREWFGGSGPQVLLTGCAAHSDIPLDAPGSGVMGLIIAMLGQTVGFPVPQGGAGRLADALTQRLTAQGGEVSVDAEVIGIDVEHGRAVGVRTATERIGARRAVIADVYAPHLYQRLLNADDVPRRVSRGLRSFELDPGTVKVDWALSGPVPWLTEPAHLPGTVHIADSVAQMTTSLGQVGLGVVPDQPVLILGQMTAADPTRSPVGTESVWAYAHVPQEVRDDAGPDGITGRWDESERERFADRMQATLERVAPGFSSRIIARRVLGPRELEARNANLVGGAIGGGTSQLHQQLIFRPVPGLGRAETGVAGLYLGSASAHPGGGVHGAAGNNAARAALLHERLRRIR